MLAYDELAYYILFMSDDTYLTRSLGFLLGDVSRLIRMRFDARAEQLGLTRAQWRVLAQLRRREGINQSALAEILEIEPITMVRHIDRLVAKELVERRPDPNDRRAWKLYLEDGVQPTLDRLRLLSEQTREDALAGIPPEQCDQLIDNLLAIKANLTTLDDAKPASPEAAKRVTRSRGGKTNGA